MVHVITTILDAAFIQMFSLPGRHFEPITQLLVKGWGIQPSHSSSTGAGSKPKHEDERKDAPVINVPDRAFVQHGPLFLLAATNYRNCKENIRKIFSGSISLFEKICVDVCESYLLYSQLNFIRSI